MKGSRSAFLCEAKEHLVSFKDMSWRDFILFHRTGNCMEQLI